jgi:iron-sulfur cluster assembly protein
MIEISQAAIAEIDRMHAVRDYHSQPKARIDRMFRVGFTSGGCENFYYTFDLVDSIEDHDRVDRVGGISVLIDRQQLPYLDHLKLDYSEDLMGGGFRFENPLATKVCGCGNSFAMSIGESERWQLPT